MKKKQELTHKARILLNNSVINDIKKLKSSRVNTIDKKGTKKVEITEDFTIFCYDLRNLMQSLNLDFEKISSQFGISHEYIDNFLKNGVYDNKLLDKLENCVLSGLIDNLITESDSSSSWVSTQDRKVGEAIKEATERLIFLRKVAQESNEFGSANYPLDQLHRQQLIALLESMIAELKAPFIDRQRTNRFFTWLQRMCVKAVERNVSDRLTNALDDAVNVGAKLTKSLSDLGSVSDLSDIL